ncbi:MAG: phenylalanine--tRNA ligase subunit beta, partial [Angelakisella sp.]
MLEYGHPMHAFDLENVREHRIVVRNAREGESIVTLDDIERKLTPEMLVIGDAVAPSAIAGVMGGELSGINDSTTTIVIESACVLGSSVRTTARKVGLRTESSGRFEKGLDSRTCAPALARACELVELLGVGEVVSGVIDVDNDKKAPVKIHVEGENVIVPTYRSDLESKADIAEEIARLYGYDKIPTTALSGLAEGSYTPRQKFNRSIDTTLLALGYTEIITYSFISPRLYDKIELAKDSPLRRSVTILNPLGEDTSVMRTTAVPSMLDTLARNYNNRNPSARLFEIATEYIPTELDKQPVEQPAIMLGAYGKGEDFFTLKGSVEELLRCIGIARCEYSPCTDNPTFHP